MDERARLKELRDQARNAVRAQKLENSPLYIACQNCGAPAEFDIIHQNYHCQHCKELAAYYLPYQVVQGSVGCEVFRDGSYRKYRCAGGLQGSCRLVVYFRARNHGLVRKIFPSHHF